MSVQPFERAGETVRQIPVQISYRIIELFSAGLYSSPNKALEELVSNSYDALANRVDLLLPGDIEGSGATIWVIDDGIGMDVGGLEELWQIASSPKRKDPNPVRPPIGKFGIGKLATYVLARHLTYITRRVDSVHAVTMDFGQVETDQKFETSTIKLDVRRLDGEALSRALAPLREMDGGSEVVDRLLDPDGPSNWTAVAMANLKPTATGLQQGRLRWILSTALPMSPQFQLYMNGKVIEASKTKLEPIETWIVGKDDVAAERLDAV
jgi:hypothetical protein